MNYTTAKNHWQIYCAMGRQEHHHAIVIGAKEKADRIADKLNSRLGDLGNYHVREAVVIDE